MKLVEVVAESGYRDTIQGIAEQQLAADWWDVGSGEQGRAVVRLLLAPEQLQAALDSLQGALGGGEFRIVVMDIEAVLPRPEEPAVEPENPVTASREELYERIEAGTRLDSNYLLLVVLSTVVAAIGLIEDNVGVVIGAMVIAPLLGPNLALALGTALGDQALIWRAVKANLAGLAIAFALSLAIGFLWPLELASHELLSRTDVGLDSLALALASGAAAVISLTGSLASVLVGVMVAVALLPPTATFGMMLGAGQLQMATGAGLLLLANVVCVNLAAKLVLLAKHVRPRTWLEKRKAQQSMRSYLLLWAVSLGLLILVILLREARP
ncbi:TIGR00341 family protein [Thioalbus denitrificans]|uniref:Putative hydrophobic protein (TIGR00341 family) n=1 Tax=Thioalbus denitrificans TaxID=547122 RepID=A0A369BXR2_9GAMM|nr:TIGR00341 family protein [Thioalbus denitrificans]RCX26492.1 putative hydrophobic protein (TIGR00341 family) [Thioalbus denitrificans]